MAKRSQTKRKPSPTRAIARRVKASESGEIRVPLSRAWDLGLDWPAGDPQRPSKPYSQSEWVFICVNEIIKSAGSIDMYLSSDADEIVESGPAFDLLFNNPAMPLSRLVTETAGFLVLYRECYWIFPDKDVLKPTTVIVAGPGQITPVVDRGILTGYLYHTDGNPPIPLLIEDVWPIVMFNPDSKTAGCGPATAAKLAISTAYQAAMLNESTLANGGKLGAVIVYPAGLRLDDDERRSLVSQFEARHMGARNAGKTAILTGGADVKNSAWSMVDMDMLGLRTFDSKAICAAIGVPAAVAGLDTEAQYSNGPAQQRFILNTIWPLMDIIGENISLGILPRFRYAKHFGVKSVDSKVFHGAFRKARFYAGFCKGLTRSLRTQIRLYAWFAVEDHPTVQELIRSKTDQVLKYTASGLPLNAIIDAFNLPFEHVVWGDDFFMPMGMVTARQILEGGLEFATAPTLPEEPEPEPAPVKPEEEPAPDDDKSLSPNSNILNPEHKLSDIQRRMIWRKWAASWIGLEKQYRNALRSYFSRLKRETLSRLNEVLSGKSSISKASADEIIMRVIFDLRVEQRKLRVINRTFFERGSNLGVRQSLSEVMGLSGDKLDEAAKPVTQNPAVRRAMSESNKNMEDGIKAFRENVSARLYEGLESGEGLPDLTKRLMPLFEGKRTDAQRAARTQTASAVSTGRHEGMKAAGVKRKSWITSNDDVVRPSHREAGSKYADGIPIDQPFEVGGESLMYPGDPAGSAGNIINCRCLQIARLNAEASFEFLNYKSETNISRQGAEPQGEIKPKSVLGDLAALREGD
jgi:HK97 family phage portal protein